MLICKRKRSHYVSASFVTVNDAPFKKSIHKKVRIGYKYPLLAYSIVFYFCVGIKGLIAPAS